MSAVATLPNAFCVPLDAVWHAFNMTVLMPRPRINTINCSPVTACERPLLFVNNSEPGLSPCCEPCPMKWKMCGFLRSACCTRPISAFRKTSTCTLSPNTPRILSMSRTSFSTFRGAWSLGSETTTSTLSGVGTGKA